jgi:hypothetical protein
MTLISVSERSLQDATVELASYLGWFCHHDRPARRADGSFATHIQGDPGFPDLVLVKVDAQGRGRVLFVELKSTKGQTSMAQDEWLDALRKCTGVETYAFRPADWSSGRVESVLRNAPMGDDSGSMDYMHPDWPKRATAVTVSAYLLLKWLEGAELPLLAEKERVRLRQRLDDLRAVSAGGEPDFIHGALKRFAENVDD